MEVKKPLEEERERLQKCVQELVNGEKEILMKKRKRIYWNLKQRFKENVRKR